MPSVINYCKKNSQTTISTTSPCLDDHGPDNLITSNSPTIWSASQNKGFIAESFVKPPVDVIVDLPHPIRLMAITLGLRLRSLKAESIQIFTKYKTRSNIVSEEYKLIGTSWRMSEDTVHFAAPGSTLDPPPQCVLSRLSCFLSSHLSCVISIKIRIVHFRTAAVLSALQVWGMPAPWVPSPPSPPLLASKFLPSMDPLAPIPPQCLLASLPSIIEDDQIKGLSTSSHPSEDIPADFLDSLTCELMTIPMMLPSGQNVDKHTLEKYESIEASWGRKPNDPFTALPFIPGRMPIVNVSLKVRIDHFLSQHEDLSKSNSLPRALGRTNPYAHKTPTVSRLFKRKRKPSCTNSKVPAENLPEITTKDSSDEKIGSKDKDDLTILVSESSPPPHKRAKLDFSPFEDEVLYKDSPPPNLAPLKHEDIVQSSLEEALAKLKSQSTFIKFTKSPSPVPPPIGTCCTICKSSGKEQNWFKLSCSHILCRSCLLGTKVQNKLQCRLCRAISFTSEIEKIHIV